jgi:hypothetical protein
MNWVFIVLRPTQEAFTHKSRRRHHYQWRAAQFRPMFGAQGLWAGRDLYRATPAVTRDIGFSGLIRRTAPFSRLLRLARVCGESTLALIHTDNVDIVKIHSLLLFMIIIREEEEEKKNTSKQSWGLYILSNNHLKCIRYLKHFQWFENISNRQKSTVGRALYQR